MRIALALVPMGCGSAPPPGDEPSSGAATVGSETEAPAEEPVPPGCAPQHVVPAPDRVEVTLDLDARVYRRDQSVGMTVRTKNLANHPITSERTSAARAVFWVLLDGRVVWRSDVGSMSATVMEEDSFTAGEAKTESVFWTGKVCNEGGDDLVDGSLSRGHYTARAGWRSGTVIWGSPAVDLEIR